jgi:hypothetical protein
MVPLIGPRKGMLTALPSLDRYLATPPLCFVMATVEDMPVMYTVIMHT